MVPGDGSEDAGDVPRSWCLSLGDLTAACLREALAAAPAQGDEPPAAGERLGRFEVVGHLGSGGMGHVLEVYDDQLERLLAAKTLRSADRAGHLERFVAEARMLGSLEHPNIVAIHELGISAGGLAYFTMKRVEGDDLGRRLAAGSLRRVEAVEILLKVCDALAFAHSRGVLHRDLKPSNIMVGAFGEVQLMDWGLATHVGAAAEPDGTVLGTAAYMPPEQAAGKISQLDARCDVYAVGAVLAHILIGEPPHDAQRTQRLLGQRHAVPWELAAVARRACAPAVEQRYRDISQLRADLAAYLGGRSVEAARYSLAQRVGKWVFAHKALASAAAIVCVAVLVATLVSLVQIGRALERESRAKRRAESGLAQARVRLAESLVLRAEVAVRQQRLLTAAAFVAEATRLSPGPLTRAAHLLVTPAPIVPERAGAPVDGASDLAFSPDGSLIAVAHFQGVELRRTADGVRVARLAGRINATAVAFSPDGRWLCQAYRGGLIVWQLSGAEPPAEVARLKTSSAHSVNSVAFSPDGRRLAIALYNGAVEVWQWAARRRSQRLEAGQPAAAVVFSPDSRRLLVAGYDRRPAIWAGAPLAPGPRLEAHTLPVNDAVWESDRIVTAGDDLRIHVWDAASRRLVRSFQTSSGATSLALHGARDLLVSGHRDGSCRVWDLRQGGLLQTLDGHESRVASVAVSPDGRRVASMGSRDRVVLWRVLSRRAGRSRVPFPGAVRALALTPDGRVIAGSHGGRVASIRLADGDVEDLDDLAGAAPVLAIAATADRIAVGRENGGLAVRDRRGVARLPRRSGAVRRLAFDDAGERLACLVDGGRVEVFGREGRGPLTIAAPGTADLAWAGGELVLATTAGLLRWRPGASQTQIIDREPTTALAVSGRLIGAGDAAGFTRVLDATGQRFRSPGDDTHVGVLAFSADGRLLASGGARFILVRDARTGAVVRRITDHHRIITGLAFTSDGLLVSASNDQAVRVHGARAPLGLELASRWTGLGVVHGDGGSLPRARLTAASFGASGVPTPWAARASDDANLGFMALSEGHLRAAARRLTAARRLDPDHWQALYWSGLLAAREERTRDARRMLTRAAARAPDAERPRIEAAIAELRNH